MALVIEFTCDLPNGVHARPASLVETLCNRFSSAIEWRNLRRGTGGNAKSALAIIGSNTLKGDACQLLISGEDEAEAFAAITAFMRDEFPHCDAPLPAAPTLDVQPVPESLSRLNPTLFHAHPVCAGSAGGTLVHLKSRDLHELGELPVAVSPEQEQAALDNGLRLLVKDIELRLLDNDGTASAILEAHRSLATDASLRQHLLGGILTGLSCAQAIV
ncbi:HPr family phosphocarrier protein, partial [Klebsiella pneumoniae]